MLDLTLNTATTMLLRGVSGGAVGWGTGRGFVSQWCLWNFLLAQSFRPHYDLGL